MNVLCLVGKHDVPSNWAFAAMGAMFQGGICRKCGRLKQGKFLTNMWDENVNHGTHVELRTTTGEWANAVRGYEVHGID